MAPLYLLPYYLNWHSETFDESGMLMLSVILATHRGVSCINLGLGNVVLMQQVLDSAYEPRLLSDHSPC